jgi:hypothetical protein
MKQDNEDFTANYITNVSIYRRVASSRPVYYSILNSLGQRSQYVSLKFPLHKQSENGFKILFGVITNIMRSLGPKKRWSAIATQPDGVTTTIYH